MKYLPQLEPTASGSKKLKVTTAFEAEAVHGKTTSVKRRSPLTWARDKTSDMEQVLVKPLKPCRKFSVKGTEARSSGLSAAEKASTAKALVAPSSATKGGMKRDPPTSIEGDEAGYVSACQSLDHFSRLWRFHVHYCLDLVEVGSYSLYRY
jgi:hypothetical protein